MSKIKSAARFFWQWAINCAVLYSLAGLFWLGGYALFHALEFAAFVGYLNIATGFMVIVVALSTWVSFRAAQSLANDTSKRVEQAILAINNAKYMRFRKMHTDEPPEWMRG